MAYEKLYDYCQTLTPKIKRPLILAKTLEITGEKPVRPFIDDLDVTQCRGYFLSSRNTEARFVQQAGGNNVIVLARDQSYCWKRFVYVKELMHLFDDDGEPTDSPEAFERSLTEILAPTSERSAQTESEIKCFWRALGLLCPEKARLEFMKQRAAGHLDDLGIALQLRIPQEYVPLLFEDKYSSTIKSVK